NRKQRISKAQAGAKRKALDRIDAEEGRRKYRVQKGMLDTEKWRADSLAQNDAVFAGFQANAAAESSALDEVRETASRVFRGFHKSVFKKASPTGDLSGDENALFQAAKNARATAESELKQFRRSPIPAVLRFIPLWVWIVLGIGMSFGLHPTLQRFSVAGI